jgi:hypothetical protein
MKHKGDTIMKRNLTLILSIAFAAVLATAGWQAFAQEETPVEPVATEQDSFVPGWRFEQLKEELGVTDSQLEKLADERTAHRKDMIAMKANLQIAMLDLAELMKEHGNDAAVVAKSQEVSGIRSKMADLMVQHQLAVRAVFTADQWEKIGKMRGLMGKHRGFGRQFRPGYRQGIGQGGFMRGGRGFRPGTGRRF